MKHFIPTFSILLACMSFQQTALGQESITATGGTATGTGGKATYTIGQVIYTEITGGDFFIIQGVQQPYEISIVTAIENTRKINLEFKAYPNPVSGILKLTVRPLEDDNMRFRLFDVNGVTLWDKKINAAETEIFMNDLTPAIYYLSVSKDNIEVKVFKIVKK